MSVLVTGGPGYIGSHTTGANRRAQSLAHLLSESEAKNRADENDPRESGDLYLDKLNKQQLIRNLVHRLERLGYGVTLEQKAA